MEEIYGGKILAMYAQVALFDAEDGESYPQWETGDERVILGPKGIAVATAPDARIDVRAYSGDGNPGGNKILSAVIQVGNRGLLVGNVAAADITELPWPAGETSIDVYVTGLPDRVDSVMFVLEGPVSK
jgi:hypothetical protein